MMAIQMVVLLLALWVAAWWRIFNRLGLPGPLSIVMIVPPLNIVLLLMVAFGPEWPVEGGFRWQKGTARRPPSERPWLRNDPPPGDDWI
jgi:hypothetical protein